MLQRERNKTICQIHVLNNTNTISKYTLVYNYKVNQMVYTYHLVEYNVDDDDSDVTERKK